MKNLLLILICILAFMNCQKEFSSPEPSDNTDKVTLEANDRSTCNCEFRVTNISSPSSNPLSVVEITAGGVKYRWNEGCYFIFGGTPEPFTGIETLNTWYAFSAPSATQVDVKLKFISNKNLEGCQGALTSGVLTYQLRCGGGSVTTGNSTVTNSFNYTGSQLVHNYLTDSKTCVPAQVFPE